MALAGAVVLLAACGGAAPEKVDLVAEGERVYAAQCIACHGGPRGEGGIAEAPPHGPAGHTWHHPDAQLREWIARGKLQIGPVAMPAFDDRLDQGQIDAVLAFIKTWWTGEQRATQSDLSRRYARDTQP